MFEVGYVIKNFGGAEIKFPAQFLACASTLGNQTLEANPKTNG